MISESSIKIGEIYYYKNHLYRITGKVLLKDVLTGDWVKAVIYKRADAPIDKDRKEPFVRTMTDFINNFEELEYEGAELPVFND